MSSKKKNFQFFKFINGDSTGNGTVKLEQLQIQKKPTLHLVGDNVAIEPPAFFDGDVQNAATIARSILGMNQKVVSPFGNSAMALDVETLIQHIRNWKGATEAFDPKILGWCTAAISFYPHICKQAFFHLASAKIMFSTKMDHLIKRIICESHSPLFHFWNIFASPTIKHRLGFGR